MNESDTDARKDDDRERQEARKVSAIERLLELLEARTPEYELLRQRIDALEARITELRNEFYQHCYNRGAHHGEHQ